MRAHTEMLLTVQLVLKDIHLHSVTNVRFYLIFSDEKEIKILIQKQICSMFYYLIRLKDTV